MTSIGEEVVIALYDYHAKDPEELTIRKTEQLTLLDGTGQWYKVRNKVMQVGLVPSNYVKPKQGSLVNRIANRFPGTKKGKASVAGSGSATGGSSRLDTGYLPPSTPGGLHSSISNSDGDGGGVKKFGSDKTMTEMYIAKYNYSSSRSDELDLSKGVAVVVITKEDDGWWQGRNPDGQVGWFPSNYVEKSTDTSGNGVNNHHHAASAVVSAAESVLEVARALYAFNSGNPEELVFEADDMFDIIDKPESDPEWYEARNIEGKTGLIPRNYIETVHGASSIFSCDVSNYDDVSQDLTSSISPVSSYRRTGNGDGPDSMSSKPWYFGPIKRAEAESMLNTRARNSEFMVRDSESTVGDLSVSMKAPDRIKHFKVLQRNGKFCIGQRKFDSVDELIEHYRKAPIFTAPNLGKIYLTQPMPR